MARDGEVKQRQHFCHKEDAICHPKTAYATIKLHGTSTCGCNNNAIFSGRAIFTFPMPAKLIWPQESLGSSGRSAKIAALLNSLFFVISFLAKWCSGIYNVIGVYRRIFPKW